MKDGYLTLIILFAVFEVAYFVLCRDNITPLSRNESYKNKSTALGITAIYSMLIMFITAIFGAIRTLNGTDTGSFFGLFNKLYFSPVAVFLIGWGFVELNHQAQKLVYTIINYFEEKKYTKQLEETKKTKPKTKTSLKKKKK